MRNTLDRSALPRPRLLPQVQEEEGDEPDEEYVDEELEEYEGSEQTSAQVCFLEVSVVGTCTVRAGQAPWLLATFNAVETPTLCLPFEIIRHVHACSSRITSVQASDFYCQLSVTAHFCCLMPQKRIQLSGDSWCDSRKQVHFVDSCGEAVSKFVECNTGRHARHLGASHRFSVFLVPWELLTKGRAYQQGNWRAHKCLQLPAYTRLLGAYQ